MFLALGVAGLILLTGTDLSVGRMVGMGMTTATIIMHQGVNTGGVFGHIFDFTKVPTPARVILALVACIVLCTFFTSIAGFFTAKFKMHPFISTIGKHACHFWSGNLCDKRCFLRSDRADHSEYGNSKSQWIPDHHSLGSCSNCHCMVYLEQKQPLVKIFMQSEEIRRQQQFQVSLYLQ